MEPEEFFNKLYNRLMNAMSEKDQNDLLFKLFSWEGKEALKCIQDNRSAVKDIRNDNN